MITVAQLEVACAAFEDEHGVDAFLEMLSGIMQRRLTRHGLELSFSDDDEPGDVSRETSNEGSLPRNKSQALRTMSNLVQILLPTTRNRSACINLATVKAELTEKFGGVTMYLDAPAEGLWQDDDEIEEDRIVFAEVMTELIDRDWWTRYRAELETRFRQEEIIVRVLQIERL